MSRVYFIQESLRQLSNEVYKLENSSEVFWDLSFMSQGDTDLFVGWFSTYGVRYFGGRDQIKLPGWSKPFNVSIVSGYPREFISRTGKMGPGFLRLGSYGDHGIAIYEAVPIQFYQSTSRDLLLSLGNMD